MSRESREFNLWNSADKNKVRVSASKVGLEWIAFCPFHEDKKTPNLHINDIKRVYYCFACGAKGHLYEPGFVDKKRPIEEIYAYEDRKGKLLFQVVRFKATEGDKTLKFKQRRPDGKGGFIWNLKGVERVIYNLPEITNKPGKPLFVVEGEKDCNNLDKEGILATTNSGGAGKWRTEYNQYFKDRDVILLPDNDKVGLEHTKNVGKSLKGIVRSIKWLILPGLKTGEDVSDWLERGGNLEKLFGLVKVCPDLKAKEDEEGLKENGKERKKQYDEIVNKFIANVDEEIGQWEIYENSPKMRKRVKTGIADGLLKLPESIRITTIGKLLQSGIFNQSEIDRALKIPLEERGEFTLEDLKEEKISPEKLLIGRGIMPTKGYMLLSAPSKAGKTLFALNMTLCLVSGNHFLDMPVKKKCKVFYIYSESSPALLDNTVTKIMEGLFKEEVKIDPDDRKNIKFYDAVNKRAIFTLKKRPLTKLKKSIELFKPDVVIVDPIGRIVDFTMNKAENIVNLVDQLIGIRNCFWVLIHHNRKRGTEEIEDMTDPISRVRGSSNLTNFAESIICIEPGGTKMPDNFKKLYFYLRRYYDPIPLQVKWDRNNLNYELMDTTDFKRPKKVSADDLVAFINNDFAGKGSRRDIVIAGAQEFKVSEQYLYRLMIKAFEDGKLIKSADNWEVKEKQVNMF